MDYKYMAFLLHDWDSESPEGVLPHEYFAYVSKKQGYDPDAPNFTQAMRSAQVEEWIKACTAELAELALRGTRTEIHKNDLPLNANDLPGTWAFKVKKYLYGRFRKFKARYCVCGDKQIEGIDYFQTYAPLVSLFAQGMLHELIYLQLLQGCTGKYGEDTILKLNKSLYGLKQAALCWFDKLKAALLAQSWTQPLPHLEPCLFTKKGVICLVYVDDCRFFSRNKELISTFVKEIQNSSFELTIEDDVYAFLGIEFFLDTTTGRVSLTQAGLINKIIKLTGLEEANPKSSPSDKVLLGPFPDDSPHSEEWFYASVVGCLSYLCNSSRPDLSFAVNQYKFMK
jgi:hypothetical protein